MNNLNQILIIRFYAPKNIFDKSYCLIKKLLIIDIILKTLNSILKIQDLLLNKNIIINFTVYIDFVKIHNNYKAYLLKI